jgi:hypothetical protein
MLGQEACSCYVACHHARRPFWAVAGISPNNSLAADSGPQVLPVTYQLTVHLSVNICTETLQH